MKFRRVCLSGMWMLSRRQWKLAVRPLFTMLVAYFLSSMGYAQGAFERSATAAAAACQAFKGRPLALVVPFRAGGGFDLDARAFKPFLQRHSQMDVSVVNMPGASGLLAARTVAESGGIRLVVGILNPRLLLEAPLEGMEGPDLNAFAALGSLGIQTNVWLTQRPLDLLHVGEKRLTASAGSEAVTRITLPSDALGLKVTEVKGFQSTNEVWLAHQRGEIDIVVASKDTVERFIKTTPQATISLILASAPDPEYPGVPYLAGPGGLVDRHTKAATASERQRRMTLASIAALGSPSIRAILASAKMPAAAQQCLVAAINASLLDPERINSPYVLASNLAPQDVSALAQTLNQLQTELAKHRALVMESVKATRSDR